MIDWMRGKGERPHPDVGQAPRTPGGRRIGRLSLALQGGGSFGAFTWGVLDRLLEERGLAFDAVSGSSAGAINAALLAAGLMRGGREAAREQFERFWRRASGGAPARPVSLALSAAIRVLSPYQFNPLDLNPLRTLLEDDIDFVQLRERRPIRLLIGATRVADGRLRIFREHEITADVLLASACLPLLHQAVEIEGEAFWDGGYAANPPLLPLVEATQAPDVLVVQIIPSRQVSPPRSVGEIQHRLEQMAFNASLLRDLDLLDRAPTTAGPGGGPPVAIHRLAAEDHVEGLGAQTALRLDWPFLVELRDAGRSAAARWLAADDQPEADPSPARNSASSPSRKVG